MTITAGQHLPEATLYEFYDEAEGACSVGPNAFKTSDLTKGKKIVMFGLPGAYTPTCSAQHVPGFIKHCDAFKAKGVDEIWCVSVNDAFVMGAWAREQGAHGKVRMFGDGSGQFAKALGLELDLNARGMGTRMQRCAMIIDDGVVRHVAVEAPGKFEVSRAEALLEKV